MDRTATAMHDGSHDDAFVQICEPKLVKATNNDSMSNKDNANATLVTAHQLSIAPLQQVALQNVASNMSAETLYTCIGADNVNKLLQHAFTNEKILAELIKFYTNNDNVRWENLDKLTDYNYERYLRVSLRRLPEIEFEFESLASSRYLGITDVVCKYHTTSYSACQPRRQIKHPVHVKQAAQLGSMYKFFIQQGATRDEILALIHPLSAFFARIAP